MKHDPGAIQALKSRLNLADIVRRYVSLRQVGGRLVGLCPFHSEKTGSFSVNAEKGFYHCFGCQASGDVIDFFCKINGLGFREGLEQLALEAGITLAEFQASPEEEARRRLRKAAAEMHALARDFFCGQLYANVGRGALDYLEKRGVSAEMAKAFQLGFSPEDWHGLERFLAGKGFKPHDAVAAGLLSRGSDGRMWDRFRQRLVFPIQDVSGKVVAFGGRIMGQGEPKYLNSADSPIYKKGEHLYGLHQARPHLAKGGHALLTEGYLDVIALHQHGFPQACGVLGTSLTATQVKRLTGLSRQVVLVFDGDPAGEKAALKSAQMLIAQGASCKAVLLPAGEDADSLLKTSGPKAFEQLLVQAREGLDFCLATLRRNASSKEVADWALTFLDEIGDAGVKAVLLTRVAQGLGLGEHELRSLAAGRTASPRPGRGRPAGPAQLTGPAKKDAEILEFAIRCPGYVPEMERIGVAHSLATDRAKAYFSILARFGQGDVMPYLDDRQKSFWGQCASKPPLTEGEAAGWWEDIRVHVGRESLEGRKRELIEAMRDAELRGDRAESLRLTQALSDLLGRNS